MLRKRKQRIDPNAEHKRQKDRQEHQATQQIGAEHSRQAGIDPRELMSREWMETVNDLDVDRDLPNEDPGQHNIDQKLGAHTSKQVGIGYITREEYQRENLKDRGRRRLVNMGFRSRGGTGSKCVGRTRERLTGGAGESDLPQMGPDLSDQLDAGFDAKRYQRSGSIGGQRFKGSTEVQVVTKNEGGIDLDPGKKGVLGKVTGGLLG